MLQYQYFKIVATEKKKMLWKVHFMFNTTNTASFLIILAANLQLFGNGEISQFLYLSRKRRDVKILEPIS